jgi:LuxR family maltose regulon positive regulatory protein
LVPRPRLLQRLDEGPAQTRRLTLISAPAGFGKTTLLSAWTSEETSSIQNANSKAHPEQHRKVENRFSWLSLDEGDNDPARFWTYVVAALQTTQEGLGQATLDLLRAPQPPPLPALLTPLLNELAALPDRLTLILDDYHLISAPQIHEGVGFLLDGLPPNAHLVIATRADPPLPIFRLRARGQLTELRTDDLRFTPDEAATFLNSMMGLDLRPADVAALEARTEGWIVGLQLAALSLQGRADAREFISAFTGSHHYVLEYLTEEVVRCQSEPLRRFLMQTSILERLCGPLCDALRFDEGQTPGGEQDGEAVLADLQQRNLFIVPLDDERRWYRYHHLFADLLGNLLRKEFPPEQIHELHRRASRWYEQHSSPDDAVRHALAARDYERAASLIEQAARTTMLHGRLNTLLCWLDALPEELLDARPRLRLHQGWAHSLSGRPAVAQQVLLEAKTTLQTLSPSAENDLLRGELAAMLAGIAVLREDTSRVFEEAEEALAYLPEEDLISRARTYVALGTAQAYDNQMETALQTWRRARDLALQAENPFLAAAAIEILAGTLIHHQGHLQEGAQALQEVLDLGIKPDGTRLPFTGTAHALLAEVYLERNDLDAATDYLEEGIRLVQQGGIGYSLASTYCTKARLCRAQGDVEGALEALRTAEAATGTHALCHFVIHLLACQVRTRLWLGDVETALQWAEGNAATVQGELPEPLPIFLREIQRVALARVYLARGEIERALATVEDVDHQAQAAGREARVIEIGLLRALAYQAQGNTDAAFASLQQSLRLSKPKGHIRLFVEEGQALRFLISEFRVWIEGKPGQRRLRDYVDRLLKAFREAAGDDGQSIDLPDPSVVGRPSFVLPEPLTNRELEVLRLICQGHSNQQICEALVVSLNTVKKHSSHIYGKLGVSSRAQAIIRAHELGLC